MSLESMCGCVVKKTEHIRNNYHDLSIVQYHMPVPVSTRSKAWGCGHLLAGIAGSNPTGFKDASLL